jgi:hypothetical protein
VDCLIVAIAVSAGSALLTAAGDLRRMASVVPSDIEPV